MEKFMTGGWGKSLIETVTIDRESGASVWVNDRRMAKSSSYKNYFDTWEEAKNFLVSRAETDIKYARARLEAANSKLGNIKGLKEATTNE